MIVGDPQSWTGRFRSVDQRFLERVPAVWSKCLDVLPQQPHEDLITENLVHLLSKDSVVRRLCWLEYQFVPFGMTPEGGVSGKGYIDIALILDQERNRYVAYECKRLNVFYDGSRYSLATPYVKEGMMRYVTEKYSEGLPIACMLGYVIDGDMPFARKQVWKTIVAQTSDLGLIDGPNPTTDVAIVKCFVTTHKRPTTALAIEIRHVFLPFRRAQ